MDADRLYAEFGKLVRRHRKRLGFTQDHLAERIALARTSITNIERGRQKILLHQLILLADALSVSPEALIPSERVTETSVDFDRKMPRNLTGAEKEWVRRVAVSGGTEGAATDGKTN